MRTLRIGSRGSALALWQASHVRERLQGSCGVHAEILRIKTSGDRFSQRAVAEIGRKGIFIKELEDALLERRVDLAVHSMKDVPTEIPPGLTLAAIPRREEVRDCLVSRTGARLLDLPVGARVGTSSLRRQSQLRRLRPDWEFLNLRGNVDTRLRRVAAGESDAIVLAKAGLDRLGESARITEIIPTEIMLPAAGQGALGIEARQEDSELLGLLASLEDQETRAAVTAERALLAELEGGCQVPLGAWARVEQGKLLLEACVLSSDGTDYLRQKNIGSPEEAERLGCKLGQQLLEAGADRILRLVGRTLGRH